jgi:hypothetical protein
VALVSQSTGQFQIDPSIAAGDFKISKDGGSLSNLTKNPGAGPTGTPQVTIELSATETDADYFTIYASDVAGAEWADMAWSFITLGNTVDAIWEKVIEDQDTSDYTAHDVLKIMFAVLCGKTTDEGTKFYTPEGSQLRLQAALSGQSRSTITVYTAP